jgi:hypothetical protein
VRTLDDARRIAYLTVARAKRCELIVRDAYQPRHRARVDRELPVRTSRIAISRFTGASNAGGFLMPSPSVKC